MTARTARRLFIGVGLLALAAARAADADSPPAASGEGARPSTGFDPTGSHPLPNHGIEQSSSKTSGCGCRFTRVTPLSEANR